MELVYLWIGNYKNISNEGFNFYSGLECELKDNYKEFDAGTKSWKLVIKKTESIKSIFPKNIKINIVVGKNGSGKTSILNFFNNLLTNTSLLKYAKIINSNLDIEELKVKDYVLCFYDGTDILVYTDLNIEIEESNKIKIIGTIDHLDIASEYIHSDNTLDEDLDDSTINLRAFDLDYHLLNNIDNKAMEYLPIKFNQFKFFITQDIHKKYLKKINKICEKKGIDLKEYLKNSNLINKNNLDNEEKKEYQDYIDYSKFKKSEFYKKFNDKHLKSSDIDINKLLKNKKYIKLFYFTDETIDVSELSHGEKFLFLTMITLYNKIKESNKDNYYLFLDELDISLHPEWQQSYINILIKFLSEIPEKNIYVILSTHSPFLLSDIPKEYIVFLDNGRQINSMNMKQTFGSNIHTLLTDSFFMNQGLIGIYAKSKIDDIIKLLTRRLPLSSDEIIECENIISILGEPILKKQLQSILDSKRLSEIDLIKKEIEILQNKLKDKENHDSN